MRARVRWRRRWRGPGAQGAERLFTVALAGNPNSGKTSVFNRLTGLTQKVGNYPGVTVERKVGRCWIGSQSFRVVDLPGTYSLAAKSPDEEVAVDVLLGAQDGEPRPDVVVHVVDACSLERGLYLLTQLLEIGLPVIVALNMVDLAEARGIRVDAARLSERLGVTVVPIQGHRGIGFEALRAAIARAVASSPGAALDGSGPLLAQRPWRQAVGFVLRELGPMVAERRGRKLEPAEALRALVDRGGRAERLLIDVASERGSAVLERAREIVSAPEDLAAAETALRYAWIRERLEGCLSGAPPVQPTWTERVDRVLTHRVWGLAIFALIMLAMFEAVFAGARPAMDAIDFAISQLGSTVRAAVPPGALQSLLADGVIAGVGMVIMFLPQILILFLCIGILEDVGYMARAAFLMDRLLRSCGLSGRSFVPMFSGFACAVPAILGARVIEDRKDRLTTMLVTPLFSCSARLPIYSVFIGAFVPPRAVVPGFLDLQGLVLFSMYALGVIVAAGAAWVLRRTVLRSKHPVFIMELPSYKVPSASSVLIRLKGRAVEFLVRAGTVILAMAIVVWALAYFPRPGEIAREFQAARLRAASELVGEERERALERLRKLEASRYLQESYLGRIGRAIEPVFSPLGWDWRIGVAVLASFPAREVFLSSLATTLEIEGDAEPESLSLRAALKRATKPQGSEGGEERPLFTVPVALSILVFFALCCQCGGTLVTLAREAGSWLWALFCFSYMTALAYSGAFLVSRIAAWLA